MKKRLASGFLALCMALALLPGTALALPGAVEEEPVPPGAGGWEDALWTAEEEFPEEELPFDWDDPIPEFVPGVLDEHEELYYPDYELLGSLLGDELPAYYDTRSITQTPTKNQGSNGLCCAFVTLAALEAQINRLGLGEQDLSELHMGYALSDWNGNDQQGIADRAPYDGVGRQTAASYLMRGTDLSGAVDEASDPYITKLLEGRELDVSRVKEKTWQAQNVLFLTGYGKDEGTFDTIKRAIMTYGGVGAYIEMRGQTTADDGTMQEDFFNAETNAYCYNWYKDRGTDEKKPDSVDGYNHAVEIAGWDDSYPRENFTAIARPERDGAWLIKNSWGKNWGDNGYAWVSYEDTSFPQVVYCFDGAEAYDPGEVVYETDYIYGSNYGWGSASEGHFAKTFVKETDGEELLTAVRIFLPTPYASVQVGGASNISGETLDYTFAPLGGDTSEAGTFFPGWYTVQLDTPISITGNAGSRFVVAVKICAPSKEQGGSGVMIGYDRQNSLADTSQAFYSLGGTSWGTGTANYCIKAVTEPVDARDRGQVTVDKAADSLRWALIRGENVRQDDVRTVLTLPTRFKGADVTWTSSDPGVIGTDGTVTRPVAESGRTVTLTAELWANGAMESVAFDLTVPRIPPEDWNAVNDTANAITWDSIRGENANQNAVTAELNITPSGTLPNGVTVTWTSSDTALINTDGTVTIPRFDKNNTATLTAAVAKGEVERIVEFRLTVPRREATEEDRITAADEWIKADRANRWWPLLGGENRDSSHVRSDLIIAKEITVEIPGIEPYTLNVNPTISVGSGKVDGGPWNWIDRNGKVTRPAYGEEDTTGAVWLSIAKTTGGTASLTGWWVTVLSYKGVITNARVDNVTTSADRGTALQATAYTEGNPGPFQYQWYWVDADGGNPQKIPGATSDKVQSFSLGLPPGGGFGTAYVLCEVSALDAAPVRTAPVQVTVVPAAYASDSGPGLVETYNLPLTGDVSIYAARYDGTGRMIEIAEDIEISGNTVCFDAAVGRGWKLFFLGGSGAPLCGAVVIS